jgi:hypothetical protein
VLPEGLELLFWDARNADVDVEVGVLPDTLRFLKLELRPDRRIVAGALPAKLQVLAQPVALREEEERRIDATPPRAHRRLRLRWIGRWEWCE